MQSPLSLLIWTSIYCCYFFLVAFCYKNHQSTGVSRMSIIFTPDVKMPTTLTNYNSKNIKSKFNCIIPQLLLILIVLLYSIYFISSYNTRSSGSMNLVSKDTIICIYRHSPPKSMSIEINPVMFVVLFLHCLHDAICYQQSTEIEKRNWLWLKSSSKPFESSSNNKSKEDIPSHYLFSF